MKGSRHYVTGNVLTSLITLGQWLFYPTGIAVTEKAGALWL